MRKNVIPGSRSWRHWCISLEAMQKPIKNPKTETSMVSASMIFNKNFKQIIHAKRKIAEKKNTDTHQRGSKSDVKPYLFFLKNKHLGVDDSKTSSPSPTHTIHGTNGIFTYIYLMCYGFHVGKYTVRPMDPSWIL